MAIWDYAFSTRDALGKIASPDCPYCGEELNTLQTVVDQKKATESSTTTTFIPRACNVCGWWSITRTERIEVWDVFRDFQSAAVGSLKLLDLTNVDCPLEEVRSFLAAQNHSRFDINPRLFEHTVASVFKNLGYSTLVTGRSGDDGIDVLLTGGRAGDVIGVQVKRYRNAIEVGQIREFLGALITNNIAKGIFITTSSFRRGARRFADTAAHHGYQIELLDGTRFLDALCIAQKSSCPLPDPSELVANARFTIVSASNVDSTMRDRYTQFGREALEGMADKRLLDHFDLRIRFVRMPSGNLDLIIADAPSRAIWWRLQILIEKDFRGEYKGGNAAFGVETGTYRIAGEEVCLRMGPRVGTSVLSCTKSPQCEQILHSLAQAFGHWDCGEDLYQDRTELG